MKQLLIEWDDDKFNFDENIIFEKLNGCSEEKVIDECEFNCKKCKNRKINIVDWEPHL